PAADQAAVAREDLDAVVAGVGDVEQPVGPQSQGAGAGELAGSAALAAPGGDVVPGGVEFGDPLHLAELRHVEEALLVRDHVAEVAELPRGAAGAGGDDTELRSVVAVDAEAVVVRIADDQVAVAVQAQAAGPALAVVGGGEGDAFVLAVEVVGLDAGGEI